jgi:hypothetical protein
MAAGMHELSTAIYITRRTRVIAGKSCCQQGDLRQMSSFKKALDRAN